MVGLFIDVWIAYIIKLILRLYRTRGSSSWRRVKAKIDSSLFDDSWVWNCPTVYVEYTYDFDGQTYNGEDSKPFLSGRFAKERQELFKPGEVAMVRVNPHLPEKSVLNRSDQTNPVGSL
ncbi:MAG TPA: DUF3592 domain-containing protein [Candidatus Angelobacter sp.]|jgi:hypothetical protein